MLPTELIHLICDYLFTKDNVRSLARLASLNQVFKAIIYDTNAYNASKIIGSYYLGNDTYNVSKIIGRICSPLNTEERLKFFKYYCRTHNYNCTIMFTEIYRGGYLEVAKWFYALNLVPNWSVNSLDLGEVCLKGYLETAKWLHEKYVFTSSDVHYPLIAACYNGHLEVAKWLYETFNLTTDSNATAIPGLATFPLSLYHAKQNDRQKVVEWLETKLDPRD